MTQISMALSYNECGNETILTLYSSLNSHAAKFNNTFVGLGTNIAICYPQSFGDYPGRNNNPWACLPGDTNLVLRLSGETNAHVGNSNSGYSQKICYGDLRCEIKTNCLTGEESIASVSASTNAHISNISSTYSLKICCSKYSSGAQDIIKSYWSNKSGEVINNASMDTILNLSALTQNIVEGTEINYSIYNKSNNFLMTSFTGIVSNNFVSVEKNLSEDILMGNATIGDTIYFKASYNSIQKISGDLLIIEPQRGLRNAKWINGDTSSDLARVNQTEKIGMYVETTLIENGENLTFIIYDKNNNLLNKTNYSVNNNIALSNPLVIFADFFDDNFDLDNGDEFYFKVIDGTEIEIKSRLIKYAENISVSNFVRSCFDIKADLECSDFTPIEKIIEETCKNSMNISTCIENTNGGTRCTETSLTYSLGENSYLPICTAETSGEYSECVNGWKTLKVNIEEENLCSNGDCALGQEYRVPCRAVALLPVFSLGNVIIAALLIIIAYFVIIKSNIFKSKK
jgi:hypothetical protein